MARGLKQTKPTKLYYEIDKDGDVVIVLTHSVGIWQTKEVHHMQKEVGERRLTFTQAIRYRVSSQALIEASPFFKRALTGSWKEAHDLRTKGTCKIITGEENARMFLVLLHMFHGRKQDLPQKLRLKELIDLAILVDYYECQKAVAPYVSEWIKRMTLPKTFSDTVVKWIFISQKLGCEKIFNDMTDLAQLNCTGQIDVQGLPMCKLLLDEFKYRYQDDLNDFNSALFGYLEMVERTRSSHCCEGCTQLTLSSIEDFVRTLGFLGTWEELMERKMSMKYLVSEFKRFRVPKAPGCYCFGVIEDHGSLFDLLNLGTWGKFYAWGRDVE